MALAVQEVGPAALGRYGAIAIAFTVETVLRVEVGKDPLRGLALIEEKVGAPYVKDYDATEDEGPTRWPKRFDLSNWGIFIATDGDEDVGGAVVAFDTANLDMLEGRKDLAGLWDIRVRPEKRRTGVGSRLFQQAVDWARQRGCRQLKIETQNINVPACRFYAKQGCQLGAINRYGYAGCPEAAHEAMLLWYLEL